MENGDLRNEARARYGSAAMRTSPVGSPCSTPSCRETPEPRFLAAAGLVAIEQVMGNFVDPRVQGRRVSVSPLVILLALLVWSWIWGAAGAILAVPMTIALVVVFAHVEALRPVALLLSDARDL